jgi:hypothetical protein
MKFIKKLICKIFHIKACQCPDEPMVVKEEVKEEVKVESKVDHCAGHTRFRVSCPACVAAVSQ